MLMYTQSCTNLEIQGHHLLDLKPGYSEVDGKPEERRQVTLKNTRRGKAEERV